MSHLRVIRCPDNEQDPGARCEFEAKGIDDEQVVRVASDHVRARHGREPGDLHSKLVDVVDQADLAEEVHTVHAPSRQTHRRAEATLDRISLIDTPRPEGAALINSPERKD